MKYRVYVAFLICCAASLVGRAGDNFATQPVGRAIWLPEPGEFVVTPWYVYSRFTHYWKGNTRVNMGQYDFELNDGTMNLEYGASRDVALDLTVGYTSAATRVFDPNHQPDTTEGLMDTTFGARYRCVNEREVECPAAPTVTLRLGGILEGTYDRNYPFAPGKGASGIEPSLMLSKAVGPWGTGVYGDFAWRCFNRGAPQEILGFAGVYQTIKSVTMNFGYRNQESLWGRDVTVNGFVVDYSPRVRERNEMLEGGVGVTDKEGRRYQFYVSANWAGRNTGDKMTYGLFISFPFKKG
ncbi:MAG: hypothetical protein HY298_11000 [Verrucomicrobia bacterium]|nr:hypothetical protein [Verrucomicrobiota bacterium]